MESRELHGTPLPKTWTRNCGPTIRPLEVGMELRYPNGWQRFVVSVSGAGASVSPSSSSRYGEAISLWSEVEYRQAVGVAQPALRARYRTNRAVPLSALVWTSTDELLYRIVSWPIARPKPARFHWIYRNIFPNERRYAK